jgi:peptidoglycan hydrolase CwlO-like protein
MADKEIKIGNKTISEDTKISLSVKTALWIISGIIVLFSTVFTATYFKSKSDIESFRNEIGSKNKEFLKEIEIRLDAKLDKLDTKNDKFMDEMTQMKLNIQQLIDRTENVQPIPNNNAIRVNENTPSNHVPNSRNR